MEGFWQVNRKGKDKELHSEMSKQAENDDRVAKKSVHNMEQPNQQIQLALQDKPHKLLKMN